MTTKGAHDFYSAIVKGTTKRSRQAILADIRNNWNLEHVTYRRLSRPLPVQRPAQVISISTLPHAWLQHYRRQRLDIIDPTLTQSPRSCLPVDWTTLAQGSPEGRRFFEQASQFGIKTTGLTVPVRDETAGMGLFCVTADLRPAEWRNYLRKHLGDIVYLGMLYHHDIESTQINKDKRARLNEKETAALAWAATGKTAWETAQILGLSERSVTHHIQSSCVKLRAANKTHAVALAMQERLIEL